MHETIFDENEAARSFDYFDVIDCESGPSGNVLSYGVDTTGIDASSSVFSFLQLYLISFIPGGEVYSIYFKNLLTHELLSDVVEECSGDWVWGRDDSSIFYTTLDEQHRAHQVWLHVIGSFIFQCIIGKYISF